jgi:uncharacterized protein YbcI
VLVVLAVLAEQLLLLVLLVQILYLGLSPQMEVEAEVVLRVLVRQLQAHLAAQVVAQQTIQMVVQGFRAKVMQAVMVDLTQLIHLVVVAVVLALLEEMHLATQVVWVVMVLHHLYQARL